MLRLLADENIPFPVVDGLRRRGIDIVVAQRVGLGETDDAVIIKHAEAEQRVVYSNDADFVRLARRGISHAGILYHPQKSYSFGEAIRQVELACDVFTREEMVNRLEFL